MKRGLFLDRDGTLIPDYHYLSDPRRIEILPGVSEALVRACDLGCLPFLFSNQSGVGRGYFTLETVHACNLRMLDLLGLPSDFFIGVCLATELPDEEIGYRKPSPRFILEMVRKHQLGPASCFMVGDKISDLQTASNAGTQGAFVKTGKPFDEQVDAYAAEGDFLICEDLSAFVDYLEQL